jgi:hypothetical protein
MGMGKWYMLRVERVDRQTFPAPESIPQGIRVNPSRKGAPIPGSIILVRNALGYERFGEPAACGRVGVCPGSGGEVPRDVPHSFNPASLAVATGVIAEITIRGQTMTNYML